MNGEKYRNRRTRGRKKKKKKKRRGKRKGREEGANELQERENWEQLNRQIKKKKKKLAQAKP